MHTINLKVQGMTCGGCVQHVTKALQAVPGVVKVDVDLASASARVEGTPSLESESLISALSRDSYVATVVNASDDHSSAIQAEQQGRGTGGQRGCCCH